MKFQEKAGHRLLNTLLCARESQEFGTAVCLQGEAELSVSAKHLRKLCNNTSVQGFS